MRPRVDGFGKKSLESGQALAEAIKATDYENLDVLPADFAYRKLDRLLARARQARARRGEAARARSVATTTSCSSTARRAFRC